MRTLVTVLSLCVVAALGSAAIPSTVVEEDFLSQWFRVFDGEDADGSISHEEMAAYFFATGASHQLTERGRTSRLGFNMMDANSDGEVDRDEFMLYFSSLRGMSAASPNATGVHIAVTNTPSEMLVMWVNQLHCDNGTAPFVTFGTSSGHYDSVVTGSSATYTIPPRWWGQFNGQIQNVLLTGLTPSTVYYYRVGANFSGSPVWSAEFSFTAAPNPDPNRPTRFAVYGDMGTVPLGFSVAKQIVSNMSTFDFDAVMHVGDIAYAGVATNIPFLNISSNDEWEFVWDIWFKEVQPYAAIRPYMAGVGNHESFYNWTAFTHRFQMPGQQSGGNGNFWFSFDYGNVHFTSLSTEHTYSPGSPQWLWAQADLAKAAANRANVPWIIVTGHRPMYCSDADEYSQHCPGAPFQTAIEPLLLKYGVDMTITGHMHCYERVHPVVNGTVVSTPTGTPAVYTSPPAPVHLVVGTAGAAQTESFNTPQPAWSAVRGADWVNTYGWGQLTAANATHLHLLFAPLDGSKGDEFWIVK